MTMEEKPEDRLVMAMPAACGCRDSGSEICSKGLCKKQGPATSSGRSFLEALRDVVFILSIFIFFTGFVYDYAFLRTLGIPTAAISVPINATFAHAYSVLIDHWVGALLFTGVAVLLILLPLRFKDRDPEVIQTVVRASTLVLAALSFPGLYAMAEDSAHRRVDELRQARSQLPASFLILCSSQQAGYPRGFLDAAREGSVTVVTESNDQVYVFYQPDMGDKQEHIGYVYAVKKSAIQFSAAILSGAPIFSEELTPRSC